MHLVKEPNEHQWTSSLVSPSFASSICSYMFVFDSCAVPFFFHAMDEAHGAGGSEISWQREGTLKASKESGSIDAYIHNFTPLFTRFYTLYIPGGAGFLPSTVLTHTLKSGFTNTTSTKNYWNPLLFPQDSWATKRKKHTQPLYM